jgi:acetolactate synthase-1/2/3 large subunit
MRCNAPLMLFVGSNDSWLAEQDFQRARFGDQRLVACDLRGAAYGEAAAALGAHGEQVASLDELLPAVARARASGLPACIDLAIARRGAPRPAPLR